MFQTFMFVCGIGAVVPFVTYFSVKFGTLAFLYAKKTFDDIQKKGDR